MARRSDLFSRERLLIHFPKLGVRSALHLGRLHYRRAHAPLSRHAHPGAMEICLLVRGRQAYRVSGVSYPLSAGDFFITRPGEEHDTGGGPEERSILYWLLLDLSSSARFLHLSGAPARALRRRLLSIPHRVFHGGEEATRILDRIAILAHADSADATRLSHELLAFIYVMLDAAAQAPSQTPSTLVDRLQGYIDAHLDESLAVPELARLCGLSEAHFKKRFRRESGMPPKEFVLRRRVARAQELLSRSRRSVTDIALEAGFPSSQYFATVYRRFTGKKPTEGRQLP